MSEPIKKVLPPAHPQLSEDLWLRIASVLPTKDWVRASGTCKALQQLQVERISISITTEPWNPSVAASALLWLASHLRGAKTIATNGWPVRSAVSNEDINAICRAFGPPIGAQPLSSLSVLSLNTGYAHEVRDAVAPNDGIALSVILQQAINLSRLNIACMSAPFGEIPRMSCLKHLSLRVEETRLSAKRVSEMLLGMPSLETLQLSKSPQEPEMEHGALVVPAWVRHVELENVYPAFLTLRSSSTRVAVCGRLYCLKSFFECCSDVLGQIKNLRVHSMVCSSDFDEDIYGSELWDKVEVLHFAPESPGIYDDGTELLLNKLQNANLGSLTSLCVKTDLLRISIPALPLLRDVRILCTDTLCIDFDDPAVSAKALSVLEVVSYGICGMCNFQESFFQAMQSLGKRLMKQCCDAERYKAGRRSRILYWSPEQLQSHDPWAFSCGCVGCEGSLGPVEIWGRNGEAGRRKSDKSYNFSEPAEFAKDGAGEHRICSHHDILSDSYDGADVTNDEYESDYHYKIRYSDYY